MSLTQHDSKTDKMSFIEEQLQEEFCNTPDKEHSHTA
jgi:hypothetical protein